MRSRIGIFCVSLFDNGLSRLDDNTHIISNITCNTIKAKLGEQVVLIVAHLKQMSLNYVSVFESYKTSQASSRLAI